MLTLELLGLIPLTLEEPQQQYEATLKHALGQIKRNPGIEYEHLHDFVQGTMKYNPGDRITMSKHSLT